MTFHSYYYKVYLNTTSTSISDNGNLVLQLVLSGTDKLTRIVYFPSWKVSVIRNRWTKRDANNVSFIDRGKFVISSKLFETILIRTEAVEVLFHLKAI